MAKLAGIMVIRLASFKRFQMQVCNVFPIKSPLSAFLARLEEEPLAGTSGAELPSRSARADYERLI